MKPFYVFYGDDDLSAREAVAALREQVGPPDVQQTSVTSLEGRGLAFAQLAMACNTVPFFGGRRLVVVEGLLERFEPRQAGGGRRPPTGKAAAKGALDDEWARLPALVQGMPPSTTLVLVSRNLGAQNAVLRALEPLAEVRAFPVKTGADLQEWIRGRVERYGGKITPGAVRLLETYAGDDPRRLDNEIAKLCTHANGRPVAEEAVNAMVQDARQASIFTLVDAVMNGRLPLAQQTLHQLRQQEAAGPYITTMLARQTRMLVIAKSVMDSGGSRGDLPGLLDTRSDYAIDKVIQQCRPHSFSLLSELHELVLGADVAMKDGTATEDLALETLVADAAALLRRKGA